MDRDNPGPDGGRDTTSAAYTERLERKSAARWKQALDVQRPYRWNIRRIGLGRTLDVGCGIGRMLAALPAGSIGVDHNASSVAVCRERGLEAYTPDEFAALDVAPFDGLLVAHVLEHLDASAADDLLTTYLARVRPGGKVVLITPQQRGYASDATHVRFVDDEALAATAEAHGLRGVVRSSFPFPRFAGSLFVYNEFVVVAEKAEC